jgi:hypothetical protein
MTWPKMWKVPLSGSFILPGVSLSEQFIPCFFVSSVYKNQENSFGTSKKLPIKGSGRHGGGGRGAPFAFDSYE